MIFSFIPGLYSSSSGVEFVEYDCDLVKYPQSLVQSKNSDCPKSSFDISGLGLFHQFSELMKLFLFPDLCWNVASSLLPGHVSENAVSSYQGNGVGGSMLHIQEFSVFWLIFQGGREMLLDL